jgi:hypothetical protein
MILSSTETSANAAAHQNQETTRMFDKPAHSRLRDTAPPKYLHRIPCGILRAPCTVHFNKSDLAGKLGRLFFIRLGT